MEKGEWVPDEAGSTKKKIRFVCSKCNHWRMVTRTAVAYYKGFNVQYCESCGTAMRPYITP